MRESQSFDAIVADRIPPVDGIMVPDRIVERAQALADIAGDDLESILYYEHPFTVCGVLAVASDRVESYPALLARIYRTLRDVPKIHCLRRRELFWLALPGYTTPPSVDDQPHLAQCVKRRSLLLHGRDCRPEVPVPAQPRLFLAGHLRSCRHYFRNHYLSRLLARKHRELVAEILLEARRLLSTALMADGGWRIELADVAQRFAAGCGSAVAAGVILRLEALGSRLESAPAADLRDEAHEAIHLFERLLKLLAEGAS